MDMKEIQKKDNVELKAFITEKRDELRKVRFSTSGSGTRDTNAHKNIRKVIARGLTELQGRGEERVVDNA